MIDFDITKRINIHKIKIYLYNFKSKEEFEQEFNFKKG